MTRSDERQPELPFQGGDVRKGSARLAWLARFGPELLLGAAALFVLTLGIARVPLLDPDEARYAASSRAMLDRGDLVVPYFNDVERLNKPALFYWLQAFSFHLFGPGEGAARLPSVVAALLVLLVVYRFAKRELGREAALRASFILLTCPLFTIVGKTGITDMTLCFFVVSALLLWYRSYVGRGSARLAWLGTSVSLGLAFFVKGPVGVAVPCLVIALFLALRGDWAAFRPKAILAGAAVAALVFMPWAGLLVYRLGKSTAQAEASYSQGRKEEEEESFAAGEPGPGSASATGGTGSVAGELGPGSASTTGGTGSAAAEPGPETASAAGVTGRAVGEPVPRSASAAGGAGSAARSLTPGLIETLRRGAFRILELLRRETVERSLRGLDHPEPLFYFAAAGFLVFFPWFAYWPFALARSLPDIKRRDPATLFLAVWFLTVLVFFSLIRGKLPTYILSATPPLALLLGREWTRTRCAGPKGIGRPAELGGTMGPSDSGVPGQPAGRWVWGGSASVVLLTGGLLIASRIARPAWLEGHGALLAGFSALVLLAALVPLLVRRPALVDLALAATMAVTLIVVPLAAGRLVGESRSLRSLTLEADMAHRPWTKVIAYKTFRPSLVFYGHRAIVLVDSARALRSVLEPDSLVVMQERRLRELRPSWQDSFRIVAAQGSMLALSPIAPLPPPKRRRP